MWWMNKSFLRLTTTLVLIIVLLVLLLVAASAGFTAIWLNTYKAFTKEELVEEISVTEKDDGNDGSGFEVKLKQVNKPEAFSGIFKKNADEKDRFADEETYTLNGDQFELGGEVVKFNNWATFLGFDTVYKLSRLESDYADAGEAKVKDRSVVELNGGTDSYWKSLEKNQGRMKFLVNTVYGSYAGKFVQSGSTTYGLYITEDGFILDELETLDN